MKNSTFCARLLVAIGAISCLSISAALAADTTPAVVVSEAPAAAPAVAPAPAATDAAPVKLPYGVDEVLKLSRAQVSEDIIASYIQSSGTIYNLAPKDIVYLRNEGVTDRVINTMLEQRKQATQMAVQTAPPPADTAAAAPTYNYTQPADAQPQPQPQPAPAQTASAPSTVYVIPYPQATAAYYSYPYPYSYSYYPYYRGYYPYYGGYCGPSVSVGLGFRFGGGWGGHYGGHYGGFHGYRGGYHHR